MANSSFEVLEFRVVIKPEWTECFVLLSAPSDGMLGVQGWWKRIIPATIPALDFLQEAFKRAQYFDWDRGAPE